jgi:nitronate monooxygenase
MSKGILERLGLRHPIFQAPLAGGGDTPELVSAVAEAGALGFIGAAYLSPREIAEAARAVRQRTKRAFGINLFAPLPPVAPPTDIAAALARVAPYFAELGLPAPEVPTQAANTFSEQLAAALDSGAAVFSFTFGIPPAEVLDAIRSKGMMFMATATTVEEAVAVERAGAEAVIAQGSEAGGHRGTFSSDFASGMVGTIALIPQMVDAIDIPVVASGGIMDGRGIAAALALGASAVQLGTAFLPCHESGVPEVYKLAILNSREDQTRLTRAFSGRLARGIINRFMTEMDAGAAEEMVLPFPFQNAMTRPLRSEAARQGRSEFLSLWAGQGVTMARRQSAGALIDRLSTETRAAIQHLVRTRGSTDAP